MSLLTWLLLNRKWVPVSLPTFWMMMLSVCRTCFATSPLRFAGCSRILRYANGLGGAWWCHGG